MKTMRTRKGRAGAFAIALALAASLLMTLPGCQGPAAPQAAGPGAVSLTIGQLDMGRAIQPDIALADFTGFSAVFARENHDSVTVSIPQGQTTAQATLPLGSWNLTVSAYIGSAVAARSAPQTVSVAPAGITSVTAVLAPIPEGGYGTLSWALTVPAGTSGELAVWSVDANGVIAGTIDIAGDAAVFAGGPGLVLWEGSLQLPAGAYFARFELTHGDYGVAALNSDLHVYQGMASHAERAFTDAHFSEAAAEANIYSAAVSIAAPAAGAAPALTATVAGSAGFTPGAVTWEPADSPFLPETAYAATVTLTANPGHVFASGATATVNGQTATVTANTGATITLTHAFPATGPEPLIAAWQFADNGAVGGAIIGPANIMVQPSGGQQRDDARLQFMTQPGGAGAITPRALTNTSVGVSVLLNPDGTGGSALSGLANNAWWQTAISTTGRANIAVTWHMRSTAIAPRDWRLQYRVGGAGEWNSVGGTIALSAPTGPPANTLNEPERGRFLPPSAEGHERLYLRWLMTSNFAVNGSTMGTGVHTHQINNLVIRADSAPIGNDYDCDHCNDAGCDECAPTTPAAIRISAANSVARGQNVTVEGFVTNRTMNPGGTGLDNFNIFVQDGTGPRDGILVWGGPSPNINLVDFTNRWVRVTGTIAAAGGTASLRNQIQIGGATPGDITIIDPPANAPTFDPQPVQLADIVEPNYDYWFMPISLGPVRFGRSGEQANFITYPTANNTDPAPDRSHFVILGNGQRLELRPPVGAATYLPLDGFATNDYIMITRAYVSRVTARGGVMQLLHAVVAPAP